MYRAADERGFALFATLVIVIIVGLLAVSGLRTTELTEVLSGNSIQRSRALQAAEGGLIEAERSAQDMVQRRVFASSAATDGVFTRGAVQDQWWRDTSFSGAQEVSDNSYPGVVDPPAFVIEEVGNYESDGGSGVVNLDRGSGRYGMRTASGRQIVLYRMQSKGVGSTDDAKALIESLYVQSQ